MCTYLNMYVYVYLYVYMCTWDQDVLRGLGGEWYIYVYIYIYMCIYIRSYT